MAGTLTWVGDLLRLAAAAPSGFDVAARAPKLLGLVDGGWAPPGPVELESHPPSAAPATGDPDPPRPSVDEVPATDLPMLPTRDAATTAEEAGADEPPEPLDLTRPEPGMVPFVPLLSRQFARGVAETAAATLRTSREVDVAAMMRAAAAARPLRTLIMRRRWSLSAGACVLVDAGDALQPYRGDVAQLLDVLRSVVGAPGLSVRRWPDGGPDARMGLLPGVPIIVLTSFAVPAWRLRTIGADEGAWHTLMALGRELETRIVVFTPAGEAHVPAFVARNTVMIPWTRDTDAALVRRHLQSRSVPAPASTTSPSASDHPATDHGDGVDDMVADIIGAVWRAAPAAIELGALAGLASFVEPELLRQLRLELLPRLEPADEAVYWFSPLVEGRTATGVVPDPALADRLLRDCAPDRQKILRARAIIQAFHTGAHPFQRFEEDLHYLAVVEDRQAIDRRLRQVGAALRQPPPGRWGKALEAWIAQSLPRRLPSRAKQVPAFRALRLDTASRTLTDDRFITVRHDGTGVTFNGPRTRDSWRLPVPGPGPWTIEVSPQPGRGGRVSREASTLVTVRAGSPARAANVRGTVHIKVLDSGRVATLSGPAEAAGASAPSAPASTAKPPQFDWDVCISYARADDDTIGAERSGWVTQLHQDLENRLRAYAGARLRFWRDRDIRSKEDFDRAIFDRLGKSAVLVTVLSPGFLASAWCRREVDTFARLAADNIGLVIDEKSRIFKVEKIPVDHGALPPAMQGTRTYRFYQRDTNDPNRTVELRPVPGGEQSRRYFQQLDELASDIAALLRQVQQRQVKGAAAPSNVVTVYLAEAASDLRDHVSSLRRDLADRGYRVIPAGDLPNRGPAYAEAVRDCLRQAALSVHLVGAQYGLVPEGETKSNVWLQYDLAEERGADADLQRLVWISPAVAASDARQQQFVALLHARAGDRPGFDLLTGAFEELKVIVRDRLAVITRRRDRALRDAQTPAASNAGDPAVRASNVPLGIYIMCDPADRTSPVLEGLRQYVLSRGCDAIFPAEGETASEALRSHIDQLADCDACLIYYGRGSHAWYRQRLRDLQKYLRGRQPPVLAQAVYVAPPFTSDKKGIAGTPAAMVLRGGETFSPDSIEPFLQQIRAGLMGAR